MGSFVGLLISNRHQRIIRALLFLVVFAVALTLAVAFTVSQVRDNMQVQVNAGLQQYVRLRSNIDHAFEALRREATAEPCSDAFTQQLRRVAYLPDGLNEFLYVPDGVAQCTSNLGRLARPYDLGVPDYAPASSGTPSGVAFWIDRRLDFLALTGLTGTIVRHGDFGVVVPPQPLPVSGPRWMSTEVVFKGPDGRWWHRAGEPGIYRRHLADAQGDHLLPHAGDFHLVACDEVGLYCMAAEATVANLFAFGSLTASVMVAICLVVAGWLSGQIHTLFRRFWAFEARFLRHFDAASIVCAYQPIMELKSGRITGCEVLVRWRDVDDRIVFPDQFLPVIEKRGLTMELTRYVVERAQTDLARHLPDGVRLQLNFNIFPRDLNAHRLVPMFVGFVSAGHYQVVVEIVETDALDIDSAIREIRALREAGIGTYLDDFGAGFSNIQHLAALPLDGVKLDRQFAMASDDSLTGQLLTSALQMISQSGRFTVVEGVESPARLAMLRASGMVDFVQGYLISRPLDIAAFAAFIAERNEVAPRLVA